jgi:hypothetical protein
MLITIQVTIGKTKVKFPFFIKISPGSLPSPGILTPARIINPTSDRTIPKMRNNFPISAINILYFGLD